MTTGEVLAQEGMDRAVNAADLRWVQLARWWVEQWSAQRRTFTSDDLLLALASLNLDTAERRALGGVVRTAHRDGLIKPTGGYVPASRAEAHCRPCREWVGTGMTT